MFHIAGRDFAGLGGRHGIQRNLNTFPEKQQHRPLFKNRPPLKPVSASGVMTRNQTDIVDLRKVSIRKGDVTYRYVLSVMDVFSSFVFLEALPDKSGSTVARVLENFYSVVGPPRILQTDPRKGFHGSCRSKCNEKIQLSNGSQFSLSSSISGQGEYYIYSSTVLLFIFKYYISHRMRDPTVHGKRS